MSKLKLLMLVGLAVIVAACSGQTPATPTVAPTAKAAPSASPTVIAATPTKPLTASAFKLDPAGMCKASTGLPKVPNFPVTLPTDQSKGSDQASAVLYEYSDFQ